MRRIVILAVLMSAACSETNVDAPVDAAGDAAGQSLMGADADESSPAPRVDGASFTPVSQIRAEFAEGSQWCTKAKSSGECEAVARLDRVTENGLVLAWVSGIANGGKVYSHQELTEIDGRLCQDHNDGLFADTLNVYTSTDNSAEIVGSDRSMRYLPNGSRFAGFDNMKRDLVESIQAGADQTCWEYFKVDTPSNGLVTEFIMREYKDGVEQPLDRDTTAAFFGEDSKLFFAPS